jgi:carbon-monoxide dehydrogenase medium subunit
MKPPPFEYVRATSAAEAAALLQQHNGEARILAGGQSLVPMLNMRLARPGLLIDMNGVRELDYVREDNGWLAIGAMTRQRTIERSDFVRRRQPLLHAATLFVGHPQIRNRGTVGGSLAHAHPASEYPAVAVALGAELRATGPRGDRVLKADDFLVTYMTTSLDPAELLTEVRVPTLPARTGWAFQEVARRHGDFALVGAAVTLTLDAGGRCSDARIAVFGATPKAARAQAAEQALAGEKPGDEVFAEAARRASAGIDDPLSDIHASPEYRRHLVGVLTRRALQEAAARARQAA